MCTVAHRRAHTHAYTRIFIHTQDYHHHHHLIQINKCSFKGDNKDRIDEKKPGEEVDTVPGPRP